MSLITEENPPGLLYMSHSPQPRPSTHSPTPQLHPTPLGDYERLEATTDSLSPPHQQAGSQKMSTLTGTECGVCGETASKESAFRKHYGVVCCEACKCFFRRTVQMSRDYKCRYEGKCTIGRTPDNMKQVCQACRFSQCIRAGMKMESVKKFPRKGHGRSTERENGGGEKDQARFQKVLKNFSKGKKKEKMAGEAEEEQASGSAVNGHVTPHLKQERVESDLELDPELEQLKYSPEFHSVLDSAVPQLFNYDSPVMEGSSPQAPPPPSSGPNGLLEGMRPHPSQPHGLLEESNAGVKRQHARDMLSLQAKKMRLEAALSQIRPPSPPPFSPPPLPQSAPYTPPSLPHPTPYPPHPYSHPGSMVNSPESHPPSVYNSHTNTPYATPYATPHTTPHGTPIHSPLPSPTGPPSLIHAHPPYPHHPPQHSYPYPPSSSLASLTPISLSGFSRQNNLLISSQNPQAVFLNSSAQMPFHVLPVTQPILPFVASFPFTQQIQTCNGEAISGPSPFSIVPIPSSIPKISHPQNQIGGLYSQTVCAGPECHPQNQPVEELPQPSLPPQDSGEVEESLASAPPSARNSPEPAFKPPRYTTGDKFPEAEVDEVLDSLRQRICAMFSWAKYDVAGFEDLSPLDQKALLRRTVAELVMLGFARASIAYNNVLLLGKTGKAIRPTNSNSGVSAVASVTLKKLVEPLKVVNMDDSELNIMKEIVLFNPESSCLRNREVVRAHRKRSHIALKEYTDKQGDLGRFGELMCLLTPLFEVSTEVTEQLRLEHFVHEGEARIDALLLMSMINGAEEVGAA